jgi:DNA-binding XRE family transcriptional regulator
MRGMTAPTRPRRVAPLAHNPAALRDARRAVPGLTQERLGRAVGVGQSAIGEAERGTRGLSPAVLAAVAAAVSVPLDTLLSKNPDAVTRRRANGAVPPPTEEVCPFCLDSRRRVVTTVPVQLCDVPACAPCARRRR